MVKKVLKVVDPKILKSKVEGDVSLRRLVITELSNIYKIPKKDYSKKTNIELLHELETLRNSRVECMIPWNKFVQDNIYRVQDKFPRTEWFSELAKLWKVYKTDLPMVTEDQAEKLNNKKKGIKKPVKEGSYAEFVKLNYSKVSDKPPKERMKELGKLWKARNDLPKPVEMKMPEVEVMVKKTRGRPKKVVQQVEMKIPEVIQVEKKTRGRPKKDVPINSQPVEKKTRGRPKKLVPEPIPLQSVPIVGNQPSSQPSSQPQIPEISSGVSNKDVSNMLTDIRKKPYSSLTDQDIRNYAKYSLEYEKKYNDEPVPLSNKALQAMYVIAEKSVKVPLSQEDLKNFELHSHEFIRVSNKQPPTLQELAKKAQDQYDYALEYQKNRQDLESKVEKTEKEKMDEARQAYENSMEEHKKYIDENPQEEISPEQERMEFEEDYIKALAIIDLGRKQPLSPQEVNEYRFLRTDSNHYIDDYGLEDQFQKLPTIVEALKEKAQSTSSLLDTKPKRKKKN